MAAVTYLLRASFLLLPPHIETPALLRRALRYVPAAVLTAIWAPEVARWLSGSGAAIEDTASLADACGCSESSSPAEPPSMSKGE